MRRIYSVAKWKYKNAKRREEEDEEEDMRYTTSRGAKTTDAEKLEKALFMQLVFTTSRNI